MKKFYLLIVVLFALVACTQSNADKICGQWTEITQDYSSNQEFIWDFSKTTNDEGNLNVHLT